MTSMQFMENEPSPNARQLKLVMETIEHERARRKAGGDLPLRPPGPPISQHDADDRMAAFKEKVRRFHTRQCIDGLRLAAGQPVSFKVPPEPEILR